MRTDLYTLVAPASDAILSVNRPAAFTKYILSRDSERDAFASKIPDIYLSIIQNNRNIPWLLLSFHPQGVILYAQAGNNLVGRIEENTLQKAFGSFAPQKQKGTASLLPITRIPETVFRLLSTRGHMGGKLQQETTRRSRPNPTKPAKLPATRPRPSAQVIRQNAPLNLMVQSDSLDLYVSLPDSTEWGIRKGWLGADLFMNENHLCYFGSLPYNSTADSLYTSLGDTLVLRLEQAFPQFKVSNQTARENNRMFYTGCFTSKGQ